MPVWDLSLKERFLFKSSSDKHTCIEFCNYENIYEYSKLRAYTSSCTICALVYDIGYLLKDQLNIKLFI